MYNWTFVSLHGQIPIPDMSSDLKKGTYSRPKVKERIVHLFWLPSKDNQSKPLVSLEEKKERSVSIATI
jgi:hypothetical protein